MFTLYTVAATCLAAQPVGLNMTLCLACGQTRNHAASALMAIQDRERMGGMGQTIIQVLDRALCSLDEMSQQVTMSTFWRIHTTASVQVCYTKRGTFFFWGRMRSAAYNKCLSTAFLTGTGGRC
jgi:hypothetical protein